MPSATSAASHPSGSFLKLPNEIRLMIYNYLFEPRTVYIALVDSTLREADWSIKPSTSILSTSHLIYAEAKPVLYANTEFCINVSDRAIRRVNRGSYYSQLTIPTVSINFMTLSVEVTTDADLLERTSYLEKVSAAVKGATNAKRLHMVFSSLSGLKQDHIDRTMRELKSISPAGSVAAFVMPTLRSFDSSSYFYMLTMHEVLDTTQNAISDQIATLSQERSQSFERLAATAADKMPAAIEVTNDLREHHYWDENSESRGRRLIENIKSVLSATVGLQKFIGELTQQIELMKREQHALTEGRQAASAKLTDEINTLKRRQASLSKGLRAPFKAA